jgi:hypothetical protein
LSYEENNLVGIGAHPDDRRLAQSQTLSGSALVKALQQGGYVIVMRHTSSPRSRRTGNRQCR